VEEIRCIVGHHDTVAPARTPCWHVRRSVFSIFTERITTRITTWNTTAKFTTQYALLYVLCFDIHKLSYVLLPFNWCQLLTSILKRWLIPQNFSNNPFNKIVNKNVNTFTIKFVLIIYFQKSTAFLRYTNNLCWSTETVWRTSVETWLCIQTTLNDNFPARYHILVTVSHHNHVKYVLLKSVKLNYIVSRTAWIHWCPFIYSHQLSEG